MSSFKLRSQQDSSYKEYTHTALLNKLGDPVNDEIMIGEDVLNLSSFQGD